jgi:hypothetical protein
MLLCLTYFFGNISSMIIFIFSAVAGNWDQMEDERVINSRILNQQFIDKSKFYVEYLEDYMNIKESEKLVKNM